jgi:hypothetical protein
VDLLWRPKCRQYRNKRAIRQIIAASHELPEPKHGVVGASEPHERSDEAFPGDHAPHGRFSEHLERIVEPPAAPKEVEQRGRGVRFPVEHNALEDARVQLRGAGGAERGRGEDWRESERGRGDARGEHARKEREGVGHAAGTGAGSNEGVEEGGGGRWARARGRGRHSVGRARHGGGCLKVCAVAGARAAPVVGSLNESRRLIWAARRDGVDDGPSGAW